MIRCWRLGAVDVVFERVDPADTLGELATGLVVEVRAAPDEDPVTPDEDEYDPPDQREPGDRKQHRPEPASDRGGHDSSSPSSARSAR